MFIDLTARPRCLCVLSAILIILSLSAFSFGQSGAANPVQFRVEGPSQRLEMIVHSSRILTLDKEVPRALVNNTEIVRVVPLSPNQVQVSALSPGVTQINLWDETGDVHSIDVVVFGDARQLDMLLRTEFPHAALRVRPLASSVLISGYVDRPEIVGRIIRMAEDYYPKVINNITVGGVQQVALHVVVMEVSRTKLRALGFDWALFKGENFFFQTVSGMLAGEPGEQFGSLVATGKETIGTGVLDSDAPLFGALEALRQNNLIKILAEPTLVTVSGRPATFSSGGEFPILVPQSLGTISIEFKQFGTRVDFVPIVLGNGNIRLEVRPTISEVDNSRAVSIDGNTIPGLRTRWADTAVELRAGQTLAIAGLIQTRIESENRGLPWLSDLPWVGALFRRVEESANEIELLILVRPDLVDAMDPHEVPTKGPGQFTASPKDIDFYLRGYLEVPACCPDGNCEKCRANVGPSIAPEEQRGLPPFSSSTRSDSNSVSAETSVPTETSPQRRTRTPVSLESSSSHGRPGGFGRQDMETPRIGISDDGDSARGSHYRVHAIHSMGRRNMDSFSTSSNPPTYTDNNVRHGMFGPTGYDKLDY